MTDVSQRALRYSGTLRSDLGRLLGGIAKSRLVLVLTLGAVGGLCEAALLMLIVSIGSSAIAGRTTNILGIGSRLFPEGTSARLVLGVALGLATLVCQVAAERLIAKSAAQRMTADRARLTKRYLEAPIPVQRRIPDGRLQEELSVYVTQASEGLLMAGTVAACFANLTALLLAALLISPVTALVMAASAAALGFMFVRVSRSVAKHSTEWAERGGAYANFVAVYGRMGLELRVFGALPEVENLAAQRSAAVASAWERSRFVQRRSPLVFRNGVFLVAVILVGGVAVLAPSRVGPIAVISLLLIRALSYLQTIQNSTHIAREMAVFAKRLELAERTYTGDSVAWGSTRVEHVDSISLRKVSFRYEAAGNWQLTEVDLDCRRGSVTAITGPSGGGKSTLLQILMRTVEPTHGEMLINGQPAGSFERDSWYGRVAYLPQEVRLIPGTIADNVRFFRDASEADVAAAVEGAALELSTRDFPEGLDSFVAEEGKNLSGGQRQRIGLARCLLGSPDLLLLDEPTSSLDPASESTIMGTIERLSRSLIVVLVTHREAAARQATHRYKMSAGELSMGSRS